MAARAINLTQELYTTANSPYLAHNPDWHSIHSSWKADQLLRMMQRNHLNPATIAEVGCGAGEILNQLNRKLPPGISFEGYEIAPDAFKLCEKKSNDRLHFFNENPFDGAHFFDLLIAADVLEHVEDRYAFARDCAKTAAYKIYHIPLELSVLSVLRDMPIKAFHSVGHLHFFTKNTALAFLNDCGQTVIDYFYTAAALEAPGMKSRTKLINLPRRIFYSLTKDWCVRTMGGFSLMVLTR